MQIEYNDKFQQALDLGFNGNVLHTHQGIGYLSQKGELRPRPDYPHGGHTGYVYAATRQLWEQTGGLMDWCVLGSADHHMALACLGETDLRVSGDAAQGFFRKCNEWRAKAIRVTHKEIGFVNGRIEHHFHGAKRKRFYQDRWKILTKHNFNPDTDLMYDDQGLVTLVGKPGLEADIRAYNRSRCEDSIEDE